MLIEVVWYILFHSFTFNVSWWLNCVSYRQHIVGCCCIIHIDSLCCNWIFSSLMFNVISDMVRFGFTILLFVFYHLLFFLFLCSFLPAPSLWDHLNYIFRILFQFSFCLFGHTYLHYVFSKLHQG